MSTVRQLHPRVAFRSRLIGSVAWLRARPWGVFVAGLFVGLALLVPAHFGDWHDSYVGVPAAIASLVVVAGALVGGPVVGAGLAVTIGVAFDALIVTDRWLIAGIASAAVIIVWLGVGVAAGALGDRYRRQVRVSLAQATEAREAVERVLDVRPPSTQAPVSAESPRQSAGPRARRPAARPAPW